MKIRLILAGAVMALGAAALVWRIWGWTPSSGRESVHHSGVAVAEADGRTTYRDMPAAGLSVRDAGAVGRLEQAAAGRLGALDAPDSGPLADAVKSVLLVYLSESTDAFESYCRESGVAPLPGFATDPEGVKSAWKSFRKWFGTAMVDDAHVEIRWREYDGRDVATNDTPFVRTTERPGSRPFWDKLSMHERRSIELVVPFTANDQNGNAFAGRLGIEIAHDPTQRRWVLLRVRLYGVPNGYSVASPFA